MRAIIILKWTTNVVSITILGLVGFLIAAHFIHPHESTGVILSKQEIAMSIAMGTLFLGAVIAFWKRILGGALSVLAYVATVIIQGEIDMGDVFIIFLALGICNLVLGYTAQKQSTSDEKDSI